MNKILHVVFPLLLVASMSNAATWDKILIYHGSNPATYFHTGQFTNKYGTAATTNTGINLQAGTNTAVQYSGGTGIVNQTSFPRRATLWFSDCSGSAMTFYLTTNQLYNCEWYGPNSDASGGAWAVFLDAGTYTLTYLGQKGGWVGIVSITIDGGDSYVSDSIDLYGATLWNYRYKSSTITLTTAGYHLVAWS